MDPTEFARRARTHLLANIGWFIVFLAVCTLCYSIAEWSDRLRGWQAEVVGGLFHLLGGLSGLFALFFGIGIYAWIRQYPLAKRDLEQLKDSQETFMLIHREVIGPIAWR